MKPEIKFRERLYTKAGVEHALFSKIIYGFLFPEGRYVDCCTETTKEKKKCRQVAQVPSFFLRLYFIQATAIAPFALSRCDALTNALPRLRILGGRPHEHEGAHEAHLMG